MRKMKFSLILINLCCCIVLETTAEDSLCSGDNWISFKNQKCFKLIKTFATADEAQDLCKQQKASEGDFVPTLASIHSAEEQEFLNNYVFNISNVKSSVWIGARKRNDSKFAWDDESIFEFSNWADGSPHTGVGRDCVQMIPTATMFQMESNISNVPNTKWRDVTCEMGSYALCAKLPSWSLQYLQKNFMGLIEKEKIAFKIIANQLNETKKELGETNSQLNDAKTKLDILKRNPVPIGFIYVQLPFQPEPKQIWNSVVWEEVSSKYAGLFFRVLGGNSGSFGYIQGDNSPQITDARYEAAGAGDNTRNVKRVNYDLYRGWSSFIKTGGHIKNTDGISFYTTGGEVRPRNQAVRIWKRTY